MTAFALLALTATGAFLALALAAVVLATAPGRRINRRLAIVLAADGLLMASLSLSDALGLEQLAESRISYVMMGVVAVVYTAFVSTLDTPLAKPLRSKAGLAIVATISLAVIVMNEIEMRSNFAAGITGEDADPGNPWSLLAFSSLLALVVSVGAFLRAPRMSAARKRAGMFVLAFGVRDALFALTITAFVTGELTGRSWLVDGSPYLIGIASVLFPLLLAYGILQSQLFDIDLRVKWGISRGTVVGIILVVVFVLAKIVESYLNRTAGFVAGSAVAGLMLFFVPKLNKVGEKVANTAMPQVQPTPAYLMFKKLEVYKAAVESAHETGGIDERHRATLDRLGSKLGLPAADRLAVETEVLGGPEHLKPDPSPAAGEVGR